MKLGKASRLLLTIGIFAILFAGLGVTYPQQSEKQSQLIEQLSIAQLALEKYSPQQFSSQLRDLESQLAQAESQLEAAEAALHQPIESIEVTDTLFAAAQTSGVETIEISSLGVTSKELEGFTYSVLSLRVKLEGDVPNLTNFILKLSKEFPTGLVKRLEIVVPEVTEEGGETGEELGEGESEKPSANLELIIHTYGSD